MQSIAKERVSILYNLARSEFFLHKERSDRYAFLAKKLAMRTKIRLPINFKRQICTHCSRFIVIGFNARMRLRPKRQPHIAVTCLECSGVTRYPYTREKASSKNERQKNKDKIKSHTFNEEAFSINR